jgi:hypothetical protein
MNQRLKSVNLVSAALVTLTLIVSVQIVSAQEAPEPVAAPVAAVAEGAHMPDEVNYRQALVEALIELILGGTFLFVFRHKISRWVKRITESKHSRMLGVVDLTQTIIEGGVLKVRTSQPVGLQEFTLNDDELSIPFAEAVRASYDSDREVVVIPNEASFKKLKTLVYGHANTTFNQAAGFGRLKPLGHRVKTVTISGKIVVYAEKDAEVSKVHIEFVPNSLWDTLHDDHSDIRPERGNQHLLLRLTTLRQLRHEQEANERGDNQGHIMIFPYDAELLDYRGTMEEIVTEARGGA